MHKMIIRTLLMSLLALTLLLLCPVLADKVTQDPNVPGAEKPAAAVAKPDERLDQKITYEEGYVRLHDVIRKLSADSNVHIYCGKNTNDWQARDLPVTVYVEDIPLGVLLHAIAEATHLAVTSSKVKGEITYRVHRAGALQTDFDAYAESQAKQARERSAWGWDGLVKMKDVSDAQIAAWKAANPAFAVAPDWTPEIWRAMAKVLACVPQEDKAKVRTGGKVMLSSASRPVEMGNAVRELARSVWQLQRDRAAANPAWANATLPDAPTPKMLDRIPVTLSAEQISATGVSFTDGDPGGTGGHWHDSQYNAASRLAQVSKTPLPPEPKLIVKQGAEETEDWGGDWNSPLVSRKLDMDAPKDKIEPSFADFLCVLHEKGNLNIVCEDFLSHKRLPDLSCFQFFGKGRKVNDALFGITNCYWDWGVDEPNGMMIGQTRQWHRKQMNLVKESVYTSFCNKLEGDGVYLEDYLFTAWLSDGQFGDWFQESRCLPPGICPTYIKPYGKTFWHLYDVLSPEDKALAKSDKGFPMSKCDPEWLADAVKSRREEIDQVNAYNAILQPDVDWGDDPSETPIPLDPKTVSTMRMYVCSEDSQVYRSGETKPMPGKQYHLRITWELRGNKFEAKTDPIGTLFPIRAKKDKGVGASGRPEKSTAK